MIDTVLIGAIFVYGIVLSLMGWRVAARIGYPLEPTASQVAALIGAMFFILSDCILAFNKFHTKVHLAQVWVLGCYWYSIHLLSCAFIHLLCVAFITYCCSSTIHSLLCCIHSFTVCCTFIHPLSVCLWFIHCE
jgi:hypothetical protein